MNTETIVNNEQVLLLMGTLAGAAGLGLWLGAQLWRKDAERWQWWRQRHAALCSTDCARAVGLDLRRIYVQTPQQMDTVTDAARHKAPSVEGEPETTARTNL
jgi:hypothetical protein